MTKEEIDKAFYKLHLEYHGEPEPEFFSAPQSPEDITPHEEKQSPSNYFLDLRIDLRLSKRQILEHTNELVRKAQKKYNDNFDKSIRNDLEGLFPKAAETALNQKEKFDQKYKKRRVRDESYELYEKQLRVFLLCEKEGKSFSEIKKIMGFQNRWDAKNYYKQAEENIKKGLPGNPF